MTGLSGLDFVFLLFDIPFIKLFTSTDEKSFLPGLIIPHKTQSQQNPCYRSAEHIIHTVSHSLGIVINTVILKEHQHGIFKKFPQFCYCHISRIQKNQKNQAVFLIRKFIGLLYGKIKHSHSSRKQPAAGRRLCGRGGRTLGNRGLLSGNSTE